MFFEVDAYSKRKLAWLVLTTESKFILKFQDISLELDTKDIRELSNISLLLTLRMSTSEEAVDWRSSSLFVTENPIDGVFPRD